MHAKSLLSNIHHLICLLIPTGDIAEGVEHLATAAVVCSEPQRLLTLFQQTLPPQVFQLVTQALPSVSEVSDYC